MKIFTFGLLSFSAAKKSAALLLSSLALIISVQAQTPATATWTLLTDQSVTTTGSIIASPQELGLSLVGTQYGSTFGTVTGWQRVGTVSSIPFPYDTASYVEYKVSPTGTNFFQLRSITMNVLGGGTGTARLAAYYSVNGFATMDSLGNATYNGMTYRATRSDSVVLLNTSTTPLTGQQVLSFSNLAINVAPTRTLAVRFYLYLSGASANPRYVALKDVVFTGVTSPNVLPITFAGSNAYQKNTGIQVDWSTASESNMDRFVVEKSLNGVNFTEAASVAAKGNSSMPVSYSWFDASPVKGNNFYRIKAVEKDGQFKYTGILKVSVGKGKPELVIAPNPVTGSLLNLQFSNLEKANYTVNLFNQNGQRLYSKVISHQGSSANYQLELPSVVKAGVYNLQLTGGESIVNKKVYVQ